MLLKKKKKEAFFFFFSHSIHHWEKDSLQKWLEIKIDNPKAWVWRCGCVHQGRDLRTIQSELQNPWRLNLSFFKAGCLHLEYYLWNIGGGGSITSAVKCICRLNLDVRHFDRSENYGVIGKSKPFGVVSRIDLPVKCFFPEVLTRWWLLETRGPQYHVCAAPGAMASVSHLWVCLAFCKPL